MGGALVLIGLAVTAGRFLVDGYLPQPFYFHVFDSFMDLYSPALWANDSQAYQKWQSIYPPLSFVFLKLFTNKACYATDDISGRACDWPAYGFLLLFFLFNIVLVFATYRRSDPRTALPRALAMSMGLPMLYALERGNLLIPCFTCFALGYGDLIRRRWPRWVALALSVNFKPYLVFVAAPFLVKRYWSWAIGCGVISIGIYILTLALYGSGWPSQIIAAERDYSTAASKGYFSDIYFATSYWPLIRLLHAIPAGLPLGPAPILDLCGVALTVLLRGAQLGSAICAVAAILRPGRVDVRRFGALLAGVALTGFTTGSAGYAQIFLFFLVFFEPWRGPARIAVLAGAYLLCVPLDLPLISVIHERARSYLGGREVMTTFGLSLGQILRPGVLLVIQYGLIALNLADCREEPGRRPPPDGLVAGLARGDAGRAAAAAEFKPAPAGADRRARVTQD
jgi:hypothetical protein